MAIILNKVQPSAGYMFGAGLGNQFGEDFTKGVQGYLTKALSHLDTKQENKSLSNTLQKSYGLSPEHSQLIVDSPGSQAERLETGRLWAQKSLGQPDIMPNEQQSGMQQLQGGQQQAPLSTESLGQLQELFKGLGRQDQLPQGQMGRGLQEGSLDSVLRQALTRNLVQPQQQAAPLAPPPGTAPERNLPRPPVQEPQPQPKKPLSLQEFIAQRQSVPVAATGAGQDLLPGETEVQRAKRLREEGKEERELSKEAREFSKPYREGAHAARNNIRDYDVLIDAAKKGDIRSPNTHAALDALGLAGFNRSLSTQLAEKITARLSQNARVAFGTGTRLTNFLEQTYQRSLPSLWNTKEGIIAISEINKRADEALIVKDNARKEILDQTNGRLPHNIEDQIDARAKPKIDQLETEAFKIAQDAVANSSQKGKHKFVEVQKIPADYYGEVETPNGSIIQRDKLSGLFKNVKTGKVEEL